ncbi:hypothetical protein WME89_31680 [Sorangium sp. So ce321]|uniref:hypothetical protein n=1 Tax=Sorangium sp. So ce321 TaxID=3133300 RepID=UPI003F612AAF
MLPQQSDQPNLVIIKGVDSSTVLGVVLGASRFSRAPDIDSEELGPVFAATKAAVVEHLRRFCRCILDEFDVDLTPNEICVRLRTYLNGAPPYSDVLVYYVGHGGFIDSQEYFLALRQTDADHKHVTGLQVKDLARTLDKSIKSKKRVYLIFDCCFAGRAVAYFQGPVADLIAVRAEELSTGVALLNASSRSHAALVPPGERYTMFSGMLIDVLERGIPDKPPLLTLRELGDAITAEILARYPGTAVRPEIHSPIQRTGDPANHQLFPNRAPRSSEERKETRTVLPSASPQQAIAAPPAAARKAEGIHPRSSLLDSELIAKIASRWPLWALLLGIALAVPVAAKWAARRDGSGDVLEARPPSLTLPEPPSPSTAQISAESVSPPSPSSAAAAPALPPRTDKSGARTPMASGRAKTEAPEVATSEKCVEATVEQPSQTNVWLLVCRCPGRTIRYSRQFVIPGSATPEDRQSRVTTAKQQQQWTCE